MLPALTSARRSLRALALAAALVSVVGVFAPMPGSAASPPSTAAPAMLGTRDFRVASVPADASAGQGSGAGFCASVSGVVGGKTVWGKNLGPSFDNVYACGPTENMGWSNDPFESDFQCVELSTRFMWEAYGLRAAPGNGDVFVANNHVKFPSIAVGIPSVGNIPLPGDVVSLSGGAANPGADPSGHTAVVTGVSHVNMTTGNGYITVMEENDGGAGTGTINVSHWAEAMGNPQFSNGFFWYPTVSWLQLAGSLAPGAGGETRVCPTCTAPLMNHGGPEMGTAKIPGDNTVSSLYWSGGTAFPASYQSILDGYLGNVASDSQVGNVYGTNPRYHGIPPPTTAPFTFAGRMTDITTLPMAGCFPDPGYSTCLSYLQVQNEVNSTLHAQTRSLPLDLGHLYVVFLPPGVEVCTSPTSCSLSSLCGYHSSYTQAGATVLYAVVPFPTAQVCTTGQSPNGDPLADGAVDTVSHQLNEAITDPLANGWTDTAGNEIGDLCANLYGAPLGNTNAAAPLTTEYNQLIGAGRYYTQEAFSNAAWTATGRGCVQRVPPPSATPGNTVNVVASLTRIANDGTSSSVVTASALSPQKTPVSGERFHFATFSPSGACGTVSPTDITASAAGQAIVTYTASATNANCTVIAVESASGQNGAVYLHPFDICKGTPLAGDFNGDGRADIVAVGQTGSCVLPSNGTTSFTSLTPWSTVPFYGARATLSADVFGNGRSDLVAVNGTNTWVLPSTGSAFAAPQLWSSVTFYGQRANLVGDLNHDGRADLIAVNNGQTWVMLNNGTGFSTPQLWSGAPFYGSRATFAADVNGDGRVDLVAVNDTSTWVMLNTGAGFSAPQLWSNTPFYGSRVTLAGDVNGDKNADLVAVNDTSIWVMTSNGATFSAPQMWSGGPFYGSVATLGGDVTGLGKMDLLAVNGMGTWVTLAIGSAYSTPTQWWTQSP